MWVIHKLGGATTSLTQGADDKDDARLIVSQIVLDALAGLKLSYPVVSAGRRRELQAIRRQLAK